MINQLTTIMTCFSVVKQMRQLSNDSKKIIQSRWAPKERERDLGQLSKGCFTQGVKAVLKTNPCCPLVEFLKSAPRPLHKESRPKVGKLF